MSKSCKQNGIRYDPRIKLLQVLIIGVLVFTLTGKKFEKRGRRLDAAMRA